MLRLLVFIIGAVVASLPAQNCLFLGPQDPANSGPTGPDLLGAGENRPSGEMRREQLLIPGGWFANVPTLINSLSVGGKEGWVWMHYDRLRITIGHTTVNQFANQFASNITGPMQTVLDVTDYTVLFGVAPKWLAVGMEQPFMFLPGQGNLLIDIVYEGPTVLDEHMFNGFTAGSGYTMMRSGVWTSLPASGSGVSLLPALRFCTDKAATSLAGAGCAGGGYGPALLGLNGSAELGTATTYWLSNVAPGSLGLLAFGFSNTAPYPIDLSPFGAPGCYQYQAANVTVGVTTDSFGVASHAVVVPANPSLVGELVFGQFAVLAPGANSLGILTSNYGRMLVGW